MWYNPPPQKKTLIAKNFGRISLFLALYRTHVPMPILSLFSSFPIYLCVHYCSLYWHSSSFISLLFKCFSLPHPFRCDSYFPTSFISVSPPPLHLQVFLFFPHSLLLCPPAQAAPVSPTVNIWTCCIFPVLHSCHTI